jgi:hypothetical protein
MERMRGLNRGKVGCCVLGASGRMMPFAPNVLVHPTGAVQVEDRQGEHLLSTNAARLQLQLGRLNTSPDAPPQGYAFWLVGGRII